MVLNPSTIWLLFYSTFKVRFSLKNNKFIVKAVHLNHEGHMTDQQTYDHYPENVRLNSTETKKAEEMIAAGGNKKIIKMQLMNGREGKSVLIKALHNIQTKMQKNIGTANGDLVTLYDILAAIPGAMVRFISNDENELVCM